MQHQDGDESVIEKNKEEEEALIKRLMSMNFKQNDVQYVIDIVTLCGKKMIELEKQNKKFQARMNGKQSMLYHLCH